MNILIPHTWLLEHLETAATPEEIRKYLALSGPSIERIYQLEGEPVYDIEITTNRVDSMNVRGIAREAAVILNQAGIKATFKPLSILKKDELQLNEVLPFPKVFNNDKLNKRTIFIILKDVKRNPTPDWMAKRLKQTGMNVHDAVIDITNYVTHELGHPIHAFDYDKLMNTGGEIHIQEAKKGEKFVTLDGNEFETVGGEVVFKNGEGQIIDLPSIKGTANTSIDESTKNVMLLAESIRADKVRFASMTHAIRTTAAQLMEKNLDPNLAEITLLQAVDLYQKLCDAKLGSTFYDDFSGKIEPQAVILSLDTVKHYLGLEIDQKRIVEILTSLECKVSVLEDDQIKVTPPTFRPDLTIPADIVEEIARIYGYHNLPSQLMDTTIPTTYPQDTNFQVENKIKHFLSDIGWQEVYTYSLVSEQLAVETGYKLEAHLKLQNPLTEDKVYLRRSLLPSLAEIITTNSQVSSLSVFELANIYPPQGVESLPAEQLQLGLVSTDDYRHVRGSVEALFAKFFITPESYEITPDIKAQQPFVQSASITLGDTILGSIGVLRNGLVGAEIVVKKLLSVVKTHPSYQPIPKTMPLIEDLTFTLPAKTAIGEVITKISKLNPIISKVELKDIYKQNHTFTIEYHDLKKNLAVTDIEQLRRDIVRQVEKSFQAQLVGEV